MLVAHCQNKNFCDPCKERQCSCVFEILTGKCAFAKEA